jgi:hypothetical protein
MGEGGNLRVSVEILGLLVSLVIVAGVLCFILLLTLAVWFLAQR